jgi:hypothetical protein
MPSYRVPLALLLPAVGVFAACGSRSSSETPLPTDVVASTIATTTSGVTTTDRPATTSPVTEPPTAAPEESDTVCGALEPVQRGAREISSSLVDWTGSGEIDTSVLVYETAPDTADYRLRVERSGIGSEMAIVMTNATGAGAPVTGDPAFVSQVQVDGTPAGSSPAELLVRVGIVTGDSRVGSGYDVTVFYNDGGDCLARFRGDDGLELSITVRAGGTEVSGLSCTSDDSSPGATEFLVRTTATKAGANYRTHDIELVRGGSPGAPAGSTADQLLEGDDTTGSLAGSSSGEAIQRYSSITGCHLNGADGGGDIGDTVSDSMDEGVGD